MQEKTPFGMKLFDIGTKVAELLWLNILTLFCSIPVITIGASFTALHYCIVKNIHNDEGHITRNFFKSFKENFGKATIIWLIYLLLFGLLFADTIAKQILGEGKVDYVSFLVPLLGFIICLSLVWVFVLLSRYNITVKETLLFGITRVITYPLRTLVMAITLVVPYVLAVFIPETIMLVLILGISGTAMLRSELYMKALNDLEDEEAAEKMAESNKEK